MINSNNYMIKSINDASEKLTGDRERLQRKIEFDLIETLSQITNLIRNDRQPRHLKSELQRVIDRMNRNLDNRLEWWDEREKEELNSL